MNRNASTIVSVISGATCQLIFVGGASNRSRSTGKRELYDLVSKSGAGLVLAGSQQDFSRDDLLGCSRLLQRTTLVAGDFAKTLERVKAGDFVYLDPPFAVISRRIFKEYGKKTFNTSDIPRLSESLTAIANQNADFLVSYADSAEARALALKWHAVRLPIKRHIAGFAGDRRKAYEWLISNRPMMGRGEPAESGAG